MTRRHSESTSTRKTEDARPGEEEASGRQREVLPWPATRGGTVTAKPNRKHRRTERRMKICEEE